MALDGCGLDVGHRQLGGGMPFEQLARQGAVARAELEDLGIGHIGHFVERDLRELLGVAEHLAGPLERADHAALLLLVDVIAVEVLQAVGLQ
jgi:hypothetical protein